MRRALLATLGATLALLALSCDPRKFDDLSDKTWYRHMEHPGEITGDFGFRVADLGNAQFVALAPPRGVVSVSFTSDWSASPVALEPPPPILGTDLTRDVAGDEGLLVVGTNDNLIVYSDSVALQGGSKIFTTPPPGVSGLGAHIAAGTGITGDPALLDVVALSDNNMLTFVPDANEATATTCALDNGFAAGGQGFSLDVRQGAGAPGQMVALGLQTGGNNGVALVDGTFFHAGTCAVDFTSATLEPGVLFKRALTITPRAVAIGDFDGNGTGDVAVADPGSATVQVVLDAASQPVNLAPPAGEPSAGFGASLAAGDFDGDGKDEIAVGNPMAPVDDAADAGKVYVYKTGSPDPVTQLYDTIPEDNELIGRSLTRLEWPGAGSDGLATGGNLTILYYFKVLPSGDDPRYADQ